MPALARFGAPGTGGFGLFGTGGFGAAPGRGVPVAGGRLGRLGRVGAAAALGMVGVPGALWPMEGFAWGRPMRVVPFHAGGGFGGFGLPAVAVPAPAVRCVVASGLGAAAAAFGGSGGFESRLGTGTGLSARGIVGTTSGAAAVSPLDGSSRARDGIPVRAVQSAMPSRQTMVSPLISPRRKASAIAGTESSRSSSSPKLTSQTPPSSLGGAAVLLLSDKGGLPAVWGPSGCVVTGPEV